MVMHTLTRFFLMSWIYLCLGTTAFAQTIQPPVPTSSDLIQAGNWLALKRLAETQIRANPAAFEGYRLRGLATLFLLDPAGALPDLELVARNFPTRGILWYYLGTAYLDLGQTDKAIDAYKQGTVNDPENDVNWNGLWNAYDHKGNDDLIPAIRERMAAKKSSVVAWGDAFTKGSELWRLDERIQALAKAGTQTGGQRVAQIDAKTPTALWTEWLFCGALLQKGQMQEAISYGEQLIMKARPVMGSGSFLEIGTQTYVALAYQSLQQPKDSLRYLEMALASAKNLLGEEHRFTILTMSIAISTLAILGEHEKAAQRQAEVLQIIRRVYGPDSPEEMTVLVQGSVALIASGKDATGVARKALDWYEARLGQQSPFVYGAKLLTYGC